MSRTKKKRMSAQVPRPRRRQSTMLLQAQLRATLYCIGDAVIVTDARGHITMMNPVAEGLTGWNENDALGKPLAQVFRIINEETRTEIENPVARVLRDGVIIGLANHTVLLARDGREIPIADSGAPVYNSRGRIAGVVLVFRDQTKERQIQNIIREARDFAESIVATVREPLVVLDADLRVIAANRAFYQTFHVTPAETDGRPIYELGNREWDIPELRTLLENILPHNSHLDNFTVAHQFEHLGQRTMLLNARCIQHVNVQTQMILLAIEDITERQRAEIELQKSEERYRHISEMISDYVYAFRVDADGTMHGEWITDSFLHVFGYTLREVDERGGWQSMVHPDDLAIALQHAQRVISGKRDVCEMRFVTRAGEARWLRDYAIPVWDAQQNRVTRIYGAAQDITERKRAEVALRESEERYRTLYESAPYVIYELSTEGTFVGLNQAFEELTGWSADEWLGRSFENLIHPDDRAFIMREFERALKGQTSTFSEVRILAKSGETLTIEILGVAHQRDGQVVGVRGYARDVTARKRAEQALRESEERYRDLVENSQELICTHDLDGRILSTNLAGAQMLGYEIDEILKMNIRDILVPRVRHIFDTYIEILRRRGSASGTMIVQTRTGEERLWEFRNTLRTVGVEKPIVRGFARDITDRKRAEAALRESEERYRTYIEQANDYIFTLDANGQFTSVNQALCQALGYTEAELLGQSALELVTPEHRQTTLQALQQIWRGETVDSLELPIQTRDGKTIIVQIRGRSLYKNRQFVESLHIARDVTERKRHERELEAQALIAQALSETLELQPLLERLIAAAIHAIPTAEKGSLALLTDSEHLQVRALYGYQDSAVLGFTYPTTWGYAGRAAREHRPFLIADVQADPALQADAQNTSLAEVQALRSAIITPLLTHGTLIGVLSLESTQPNAFNEHDLRLLTSIATSASLAIERARLVETMQHRLRELEILQTLSSELRQAHTIAEMIPLFVKYAAQAVQAQAGSIYLLEESSGDWVSYGWVNAQGEWATLSGTMRHHRGEGVTGKVGMTGEIYITQDWRTDTTTMLLPGEEQLLSSLHSGISLPLRAEQRVIGVMHIWYAQPHHFGETEKRLLTAIADMAGNALHRARLFAETQRRAETIAAVNALGRALAATLDLPTIYRTTYQHIRKLVPCDNLSITLYDTLAGTLRPAFVISDEQELDVNLFPPLTLDPNAPRAGRAQAVLDAQIVVVNDLAQKRRQGGGILAGSEAEPQSAAYTPMLVEGKVIGLLELQSYRHNAYQADDLDLLQMIANQIGLAIQNARLFDETRRRATQQSALNAILIAASRVSDSLDSLLQVALDHLLQSLGLDMGAIVLRPGDLYVIRGLSSQLPSDALQVVRQANLSLERTFIEEDYDTSSHPMGEVMRKYGIRAGISAPLIGEQIIGSISVASAIPRRWTADEVTLVETFGRQVGMLVQRARLFDETRRRLNELNALHQASQTLLISELDPEATYHAIHQAIARTMPCEALSIVLEDEALGDYHGVYLYDKIGRTPSQRIPRGAGLSGRVIPSGQTLVIDDYPAQSEINAVHFGDPEYVRSILAVPLRRGEQTIGMIATQSYQPNAFTEEHRVLLETLAAQFATSIENARLYEQTRLRLRELEIVSAVSAALRAAPSHNEMFAIVLDQLMTLLNVDGAAIQTPDPIQGGLIARATRGVWAPLVGFRIPPGKGLSAQVLATGKPYFSNDARNDPRIYPPNALGDCRAIAGVPLAVPDQLVGLLWIASKRSLTDHDLRLLLAVADIAANAIHRATLNEQTQQQLERLSTLRAIDQVISSSFDLKFTLDLLLEHTLAQLGVDAASVLVLNPQTQVLEYAAARGFRTRAVEQTRVPMGKSFAGRVALERQSVHIRNLPDHAKEFVVTELVAEDFAEYYGVPLIAKGNVVGVMQIFHHAPLPNDQEWFDFCETLAGQAAIAIDNARLFGDLQHANVELTQAYEATIEGWSRALDLRDKETEGHTQRVAEMTLELARALGIGEEEMVHVRRGALLHDIGKMGVPDNILLKPGKLTEAEMAIMREHPQRAYELLLPIEYLRPALDIPYCHHEKWDGTGYPRGLKGEEIPLVARIFAVVDVYDALTSDRPYRRAWSREDAFEYIRQQAGKHFDPHVVEIFLKMFGK